MMDALRCRGAGEYGHGMSLTIAHAGGCCEAWRGSMLRILGSLAHGYALAYDRTKDQAWLVTDPVRIIASDDFRQLEKAGMVVSYGAFYGTETEYHEITNRGLAEYKKLKKD